MHLKKEVEGHCVQNCQVGIAYSSKNVVLNVSKHPKAAPFAEDIRKIPKTLREKQESKELSRHPKSNKSLCKSFDYFQWAGQQFVRLLNVVNQACLRFSISVHQNQRYKKNAWIKRGKARSMNQNGLIPGLYGFIKRQRETSPGCLQRRQTNDIEKTPVKALQALRKRKPRPEKECIEKCPKNSEAEGGTYWVGLSSVLFWPQTYGESNRIPPS